MLRETMVQFAKRLDVSQPLISRWKSAGRLVMDGNKIDVVRSLDLLEQTAGRDDLARLLRAKDRLNGEEKEEEESNPEELREELRRMRIEKARAEARIKKADADTKEMERDKLAGELIHVEDVDYVLQDFGALLRVMLDGRAERVGAQIGLTPDQIQGLAESDEQLLSEMANKLKGRTTIGEAGDLEQAPAGRDRPRAG